MVRRTGQQGVPVIQVGDQFIVGFDQQRLAQALEASATRRPAFGAAVADAARQSPDRPGADRSGAYVGRVRPDSAAQRAGVRSGDVIVALNGTTIDTAAELEARLQALHPGDALQISFRRRGEPHTGEARL